MILFVRSEVVSQFNLGFGSRSLFFKDRKCSDYENLLGKEFHKDYYFGQNYNCLRTAESAESAQF